MKKTSFILLTSFLSFMQIYSQWLQQNSGTNFNINAVDFINSSTGWAAGDNSKVYRTTNGGVNWTTITIPGNPVNITHAVAKEFDKMYVGKSAVIFGTTNSGVNWFQTVLGAHFNIGALDEQGGNLYAAAYLLNNAEDTILNAIMYRSTNNGINWSQISSVAMNTAGDPIHGVDVKLGMCFVSNDTGYIATVRGVYKTINGGQTYTILQSGPSTATVVAGSNNLSSTGSFMIAGDEPPGKLDIYKSTNRGSTWILITTIPNPTNTKRFSGISCPANTDKIYLTISSGNPGSRSVQDTSLYYSSNGGINWYYQTLPVNNVNIYSVDFPDSNTGFIAGSDGTILKTTNGGGQIGIHQISTEVPGEFSLFQNYPNPFNPATKIKFSVPEGIRFVVSLSIYDILGREAASLVKDKLEPGEYEVDWNASGFPSGMYFYKLSAGQL